MKKLKGYDEARVYSDSEKLPVGGYILKILDVDYQTYDWGDIILLSFDIDQGDYKGFFTKNYQAQMQEDKKWKGTYRLRVPSDDDPTEDAWKMRRFKTIMNAFEDSNSGYHWDWDEKTLKGKLIGGIFNNKEYEIDGRRGFYTNCYSLLATDKIIKGDFKIPADTLLRSNGSNAQSSTADSTDDFMNIPDNASGAVPFD